LVNKTESGEIDVNLSGKLGYLCSILHRVIEGGDLEERLAKLEKQFASKGGK
jgi:flagellar biosynthesis/type III secretory pathway protein FliH